MAAKSRRIRAVVEEVGSSEPAKSSPVVEETPVEEPQVEATPVETQKVEETTETTTPEPTPPVSTEEPKKEKKTNFKLVLIITILTALVVGFVSGGVYVYFTGVKQAQTNNEVEASPTPIPTTTPSPTPTAMPEEEVVDLSVYDISILNGSGKIGEAGKASDLVEGAGFSVSDTGNAASFDFEATIIEAKADVPKSVISKLKTALETSYTVEVGDELTKTSNYDIVITVGAK